MIKKSLNKKRIILCAPTHKFKNEEMYSEKIPSIKALVNLVDNFKSKRLLKT